MSVDAQLVANIEAFLNPYIDRGGNWYWEQPLVQLAKICFKVADAPGGNPRLTVSRPTETTAITGTGDPRWNLVIAAVAQQLPTGRDFHRANYKSASQKTALARSVAVLLLRELETASVSH